MVGEKSAHAPSWGHPLVTVVATTPIFKQKAKEVYRGGWWDLIKFPQVSHLFINIPFSVTIKRVKSISKMVITFSVLFITFHWCETL